MRFSAPGFPGGGGTRRGAETRPTVNSRRSRERRSAGSCRCNPPLPRSPGRRRSSRPASSPGPERPRWAAPSWIPPAASCWCRPCHSAPASPSPRSRWRKPSWGAKSQNANSVICVTKVPPSLKPGVMWEELWRLVTETAKVSPHLVSSKPCGSPGPGARTASLDVYWNSSG